MTGTARGSLIVVGSGVAGLTAALRAADHVAVTLVTKSELAESNTRYAQGGIAAALFDDDNVASHVLDTLRAGAGLNDYDAVEALCAEGPDRVRELIARGVAFDRERGALARGLEAAHSRARVLHAGGDATGAAIEAALIRAVLASGVEVLEHRFLADLIVHDGRVVGVELIDGHGAPGRRMADAVLLATGGAGQLFAHTTNPAVATGDGVAAAWRAGALLRDLEFYQFHPTTLAVPGGLLVSEAVRGEGATLVNARGERFMSDVHPDAELAPRDVVARSIATEMTAQGGAPVLLDARHLGGAHLARRFPTIDAGTRAAGFDWAHEPIPVTPAAHYWMGGVATDVWGRTSLPGLFAAGEVACTGVHGANRLASNSLLEGLVFADRAVRALLDDDPSRIVWRSRAMEPSRPRERSAIAPATHDRVALQALMWNAAGVQRSGDGLRAAAETLASWPVPSARASVPARDGHPSTELAQREDANLLDLARILVTAALAREESRGAHFRSDFPVTSTDAQHLQWAREEPIVC